MSHAILPKFFPVAFMVGFCAEAFVTSECPSAVSMLQHSVSIEKETSSKQVPEFISKCPTSACCDVGSASASQFGGNALEQPSDGVWVYLFGGAEFCFTDGDMFLNFGFEGGLPSDWILEEAPAVAHGRCMTYAIETADGTVHSQVIATDPDACTHGTAWRTTQDNFDRYQQWWMTVMNPPYESIPVNVTTMNGRRLPATVLHHAKPLKFKDPSVETGPTVDYIQREYCEMVQRSYCPSYVAQVHKHLVALGVDMSQVTC